MTNLFAPAVLIAIAAAAPLAAQAQLRPRDTVDFRPAINSALLHNLYIATQPPVNPALAGPLLSDDSVYSYNKPARLTLGVRLASPISESGASSTFVFAATVGRPISTDCQMYSLTPCQQGVPASLAEMARIRSLSLSYTLRY